MQKLRLIKHNGHYYLGHHGMIYILGSGIQERFYDHISNIEGKTFYQEKIAILNEIIAPLKECCIKYTEVDDYNGHSTVTIETKCGTEILVRVNQEEVKLTYKVQLAGSSRYHEDKVNLLNPSAIPIFIEMLQSLISGKFYENSQTR